MALYIGNRKVKSLHIGNKKVKKVYVGSHRAYSSGSTVTYWVDSGQTYTEERDEGENCLSPKTFTPAKSGWTFAGWKEDAAASGSVLGSKVMSDTPITLYAVFQQTITLTAYNGSASPSAQSKYRYYNNGNVANPAFTVSPAALSGWSFNGWCTSAAASAGIAYASISNMQLSANLTVYGRYSQTITLSYNGNGATGGSVAAQSGTRYFNSGNYSNPVFVVAGNGFTVSGANFSGWATSASGAAVYSPGSQISIAANTTLYAAWAPTFTSESFGYTGGIQTFVVPWSANYKLEVWGAQGGRGGTSNKIRAGGAGGYSVGAAYLAKGTVLYITVGGSPAFNADGSARAYAYQPGGFNGGGNGNGEAGNGGGGGGGATHIATASGVLSSVPLGNVLIAAGGGGGAGNAASYSGSGTGGAGGGTVGGNGADGIASVYKGGTGGTQSQAGYDCNNPTLNHTGGYGKGGSTSTATANNNGGGGGGLYGGGAGSHGSGGGGGSGYVGSLSNAGSYNGYRSGHGMAAITRI